jgi:ADP-heptose:LPS heptosyltransferase
VLRIAIIEPFQMGDVLSVSPMLDIIHSQKFTSHVYLISKDANKYIYEDDSRVKSTFVLDFPWTDSENSRISFGTLLRYFMVFVNTLGLRKHKFDIGIDVRGDVRSQLILNWIGCKTIVGHTNYLGSNINLNGWLLDRKVNIPITHRFDWNIATLTALGFTNVKVTLPSFSIPKEKRHISKNYIVIHYGAGWKYRRWKMKKWEELVKKLKDKFPNLLIVVVGGEFEYSQFFKIKGILSSNEIIFRKTSFRELVNLLYFSEFFIGLDSGPMNLAAVLNKKTLVLFGPGNSTIWGPYEQKESIIHKQENFSCSPCIQKKCIYKSFNCMDAIEVQDVLRRLNKVNAIDL